ncbi:MAG TPA: CpXC domain-containing protein [Thermomicrobiaceae bacterium]|nr:CpXC domain-containing protein [Thermomicrobiaceae bacterium]
MDAPSLETSFTGLTMRCGTCSAQWEAPAARFVNVQTDPDARLGLLLDSMHYTHCPVCRERRPVEMIFDYYDPDRKLLVQVRPEWEYEAGGGEDWYWARYEDLVTKYAEVDVQVDVVFGRQQIVDKYLGGEEAVAAARQEWAERRARAEELAAAEAESDVDAPVDGTSDTAESAEAETDVVASSGDAG